MMKINSKLTLKERIHNLDLKAAMAFRSSDAIEAAKFIKMAAPLRRQLAAQPYREEAR
jgi:hypothetical protein